MPVRNGHRFIRKAIDSLLMQTVTDFELIVCDNASTDATESICREYAAQDRRVRYFRNETNIGPAGNYNRCFALSRGEFFRWHAHDDMCLPTYLQKCIEVLDADQSVVIAYPRTQIVDAHDQPTEQYDFHPATDSPSVAHRFEQLVMVNHRMHRACEIFGLMRASAMLKTPLQGAYARGDSVFLARMALLGRFVELPERLFLSRAHASQSMQNMPSEHGRNLLRRLLGTGPLPPTEWWNSSRKGKVNFPEWNLFRQYWNSAVRAPLPPREKLACCLVALKWIPWNLHKLFRDVIFAGELVYSSVVERVSADGQPASELGK